MCAFFQLGNLDGLGHWRLNKKHCLACVPIIYGVHGHHVHKVDKPFLFSYLYRFVLIRCLLYPVLPMYDLTYCSPLLLPTFSSHRGQVVVLLCL